MPAENQPVNATFNISTENSTTAPTHLFINLGSQGISFVELDRESNTFISVMIYHFGKHFSTAAIAAAINNMLTAENFLQQNFAKVEITWCVNESILVPQEYFDKSTTKEMLDLVYGDATEGIIKTGLILKHNLYGVHKIPAALENSITAKFPNCYQTHQSSLLIDFSAGNKDFFYCNFYTDSLTVLLRKSGNLQLIQNFEFATPEDVVYHLVNVCRSFEVDATQISLTVSGMIDATSNLYNELYKYFAVVGFSALPDNFNYAQEIKNYPAHYFSHLFATAACVL